MIGWRGRAWCFGDDVNTDVMIPGRVLGLPSEEMVKFAFDAIRPRWVETVEVGDVVVGGRNFGTGSARPVAALLRTVGIRAFFAESMASLFARNSINSGVLALALPGVTSLVSDGQPIEVRDGELLNLASGEGLALPQIPPLLSSVLEAGGLIAQLRLDGYLPQEPTRVDP